MEANQGSGFMLNPSEVTDPERQLSDEQIIELKQAIQEDPRFVYPVGAEIGYRTCFEEAGMDPSDDAQVKFYGATSADWAIVLKDAIELPGAEWPEDAPTPATFAEALDKVKVRLGMVTEADLQ